MNKTAMPDGKENIPLIIDMIFDGSLVGLYHSCVVHININITCDLQSMSCQEPHKLPIWGEGGHEHGAQERRLKRSTLEFAFTSRQHFAACICDMTISINRDNDQTHHQVAYNSSDVTEHQVVTI
jgi:hypothetical protein